jgi:hypothetical protein
MLEKFFQPLHLLVILFIAVISYAMPFLAGYFLGRYVEIRKSKDPNSTQAANHRLPH